MRFVPDSKEPLDYEGPQIIKCTGWVMFYPFSVCKNNAKLFVTVLCVNYYLRLICFLELMQYWVNAFELRATVNLIELTFKVNALILI